MPSSSSARRISTQLVGQEEDASGQIGLQRRLPIVAAENPIFPDQQVGIAAGKFVPVIAGQAVGETRHARANQEEVSVSDGFVVTLRLAAGRSKAFQGC